MRKSLLAHCLIIINIVYIVATITFSLMCIIVLPVTVQNDLLSLGLQVYDFAVTWLPRSLTPRCHVPYRVIHTPRCPTQTSESDSAVSCPLQSNAHFRMSYKPQTLTPRCQSLLKCSAYHREQLCVSQPTMEYAFPVSSLPQGSTLQYSAVSLMWSQTAHSLNAHIAQ